MSYAAMSDSYHAGKKVYGAYKQGGAKAATKEAGNILYESSGAKAIVQTAKGVAKGDPEAIGAAAVIVASGKALSKAGGAKASAESVTVAESTNYSKLLNPTSEFDPVKTLYRGTTGSESKSSALFLTDNAEVAGTYTKNGGQVMQYDLSNSGLYILEKTGELEYKTGINVGSTTVSTEYLFKGKDLVKAVNEKATPHNP